MASFHGEFNESEVEHSLQLTKPCARRRILTRVKGGTKDQENLETKDKGGI